MKRLCSLSLLLALAFVSVAHATDPGTSDLTRLPLLSPARFSIATDRDINRGEWNQETLTLRLSDRLGIGAVRNGVLHGSAGLKYQAPDGAGKLSLMALIAPNPFRYDFLAPNPAHHDRSRIVGLYFKITL